MTKPLDGYQPRSWSTYSIDFDESYNLPTGRPEELLEALAESDMTKAFAETDGYDPSGMFFFDYEQMAAGRTPYGTGPLLALTDTYRDHEVGKLAFVSYEGMDEDPPTYLLFVEN